MKISDEELRQCLERSSAELLSGGNPRLLLALSSLYPELTGAFIVGWTPDQGEEVFTVVVVWAGTESEVVFIELSRTDSTAEPKVLETCDLYSYMMTRRTRSDERRYAKALLEMLKRPDQDHQL